MVKTFKSLGFPPSYFNFPMYHPLKNGLLLLYNERGQNTHDQGERVKIPLLSNQVGKRSGTRVTTIAYFEPVSQAIEKGCKPVLFLLQS